jgi:anti-sigma factor RsiW
MNHLGDLLSAHLDGELSGVQLDRVNAHLAACGDCRVEASSLRRIKHELRSLGEVTADTGDLTGRLLAMTPPAGGVPLRSLTREYDDYERHLRRRLARRPAGRDRALPMRPPSRRRGRYVLWGTLSLVVVGVGTAAFGMGGGGGATGPQIKPQLEVFDVQHAITAGDVPFSSPTRSRVPAVAATPLCVTACCSPR